MDDHADDTVVQVMSEFDFAKTAKIMHQLDHRWYVGGGIKRTPTEDQIRRAAKRILEKVAASPNSITMSSGGLEASKTSSGVRLRFVAIESGRPR